MRSSRCASGAKKEMPTNPERAGDPVAFREELPQDHARPSDVGADRSADNVVASWKTDTNATTCTVGWPGHRPRLAEVLPLFEHLGLELVDHRPCEVQGLAGDMFTFQPLSVPDGAEVLPLLREAFLQAWEFSVDRDDFAILVRTARLRARQVQLLRAIFQYLRLAHLGASRAYVRDILSANPEFVRHWIELFEARFDPVRRQIPEDRLAKYVDAARTRDEFRVLNWYAAVGSAVTRTSYFRTGTDGRPNTAIVLKLDPARLPFPSGPAVKVETFVHHPLVAGLHIRCGPVARGGLRWSDRIEDYRDEVLALANAQQVKNSLIVPAGAKGAFVIRMPLGGLDAAATMSQVKRCYTVFVRGLLDVTDNLMDGVVVQPAETVVTDDPDPYLVVAADKGTALFSDLANAEAQQSHFWLDDGFASGGSTGFDHKGLGVTARGAWVAVRRHLAELGIDPDEDDLTVVGIGDMSGDVFGNGMLLSEHIRLVAAFDHRHIFLDPDPEPRQSFAERSKLARLPSSSWADYDAELISPGGGVFLRSARHVPLSQQMRSRLNLPSDADPSPDEVIQAILRAPVDLMWNGGVGTFVRASHESDAHVSDRSNNRIRITASQLRCRVIGEGGNLGLTQAARVEFALRGGKVNADFIDNAAGVNTSDREVNLKILLGSAVSSGMIDRAERDEVLRTCAPHVVAQVLRDNEEQTWAISVAEAHGPSLLDRHEQVMTDLAESGLERVRENLPDAAEIAERRASGRGLTRPEIAVLLAYAKNAVHKLVFRSSLPDADSSQTTLVKYFPEPVRVRFADQIRTHQLAREIVATRLSNDVINRVGPGFLYRVEDQTGAPTEQVVRAFLIVRDLFGLEDLWRELGGYPVPLAITALAALERVLECNVCWLMRRRSKLTDPEPERRVLQPAVQQLQETAPAGRRDAGSALEECFAHLAAAGASPRLIERCRAVAHLQPALAMADAARESGVDVAELAAQYEQVCTQSHVAWLRKYLEPHPTDTHWIQLAKSALYDQFTAITIDIAIDVFRRGGFPQWTVRNAAALDRARSAYSGLADSASADIASLTVGVQALRDLSHATMSGPQP